MNDIERMKEYLDLAESSVDTVYVFAAEKKGPMADLLRKNMNHIALFLNENRELLDSMNNE
jgi:hypothetical protein